MAHRVTHLPRTQQPQDGNLRPASAYADLHAAFVGSTDALIGAAPGNRWTRNGSPTMSVERDGIASATDDYANANYWTGPSVDGGSLTWPGVTVVAVLPRMVTFAVAGQQSAVLSIAPSGDYYGVAALIVRRNAGSVLRNIGWYAGDSSSQLTPGTYGAWQNVSQWASNDRLVIVARWDKSTTSIAVDRNGTVTSNSNAHAYGWRTGAHVMCVGSDTRASGGALVSPLALAAVIPRDVGAEAEAELLGNPWALFAPRRVLVPVAAGAPSGITGTLAATLGDVTLASTGTLALSGAAAITLGNVIMAATGSVSISGAVGATLGNVTLSATGALTNRGALAATLGNVTLAATGGSTNTGQLAVTLGDVTTVSAASLSINAQLGGTLDPVTLAATGSIRIAGSLAQTLGNVTLAATGVLGSTVTGQAAITLGNVTSTSTGTLALSGAVGATLGNVTLSATGKVSLAGSAAIALGNVTSAATGSVAIRGAMLATLGNVTLAATGGLEVPTVDGPAGYGYPPMRRSIARQRNNDYMFRPRAPNTRR